MTVHTFRLQQGNTTLVDFTDITTFALLSYSINARGQAFTTSPIRFSIRGTSADALFDNVITLARAIESGRENLASLKAGWPYTPIYLQFKDGAQTNLVQSEFFGLPPPEDFAIDNIVAKALTGNRIPDVALNLYHRGYFEESYGVDFSQALLIASFEGALPYATDYTGNPDGHLGQVGTVAGGVIYRPGKFGKAIQLAAARTNLVDNPSIETNTTHWTSGALWFLIAGATISQSATQALYGSYSLKVVTDGTHASNGAAHQIQGALTAGGAYTGSVWIYPTTAGVYTILLFDTSDGQAAFTSPTLVANQWQKMSITLTVDGGGIGAGSGYLAVRWTGTSAVTFYLDAAQVEGLGYPTSYLDGSLGTGHAWTGTAHASTSTRTAASLYYVNPLSTTAGTISLWWIPAANQTGPDEYFFSEGNLKAYFNAADDKIYFTDGTNTISTAALTFSATVAQRLTFTWSSTGLNIHRNGANAATGATYTAPTLGANLYIGSDTAGANQANGLIDNLGILNVALTAAQDALIYASGYPITPTASTMLTLAGGPQLNDNNGAMLDIPSTFIRGDLPAPLYVKARTAAAGCTRVIAALKAKGTVANFTVKLEAEGYTGRAASVADRTDATFSGTGAPQGQRWTPGATTEIELLYWTISSNVIDQYGFVRVLAAVKDNYSSVNAKLRCKPYIGTHATAQYGDWGDTGTQKQVVSVANREIVDLGIIKVPGSDMMGSIASSIGISLWGQAANTGAGKELDVDCLYLLPCFEGGNGSGQFSGLSSLAMGTGDQPDLILDANDRQPPGYLVNGDGVKLFPLTDLRGSPIYAWPARAQKLIVLALVGATGIHSPLVNNTLTVTCTPRYRISRGA